MSFPQLKINQSMGKIGIKRQPGSFEIKNNPTQVKVDHGTKKPLQIMDNIEIKNPPADLKIDQTKALEDVGIRSVNALTKHLRQKALKKTMQGIREIAQEGDKLAKIENKANRKGKAIAQLAKQELADNRKFGVKLVPSSPPEIKVKTNPVEVKAPKNDINVSLKGNIYPEVKAKPDKYEIYLAQKGKLEIEVVGNNLDYQG